MENFSIAQNLDKVRRRMDDACSAAGRSGDSVRLVAVSKTIDLDLVLDACRAGQWEFGENRIPEALTRQKDLADRLQAEGLNPESIRWHFIGHLQSRKSSSVSRRFALLHGVDSLKLARKLDALAQAAGFREPILLEVNAGREARKDGLALELAVAAAEEMAAMKGLALQGMMTMAPYGASEKILRETFARLRRLNEEARIQTGLALPELSMGMSNDFEEAIAEGATLVRVGSAVFGHRSL